MSGSVKFITTTFFTVYALALLGSPAMNDSLRIEVLMSNKMLNSIHLDANFINAIDITPKRLILLSTTDQFYLLGWGGIKPVGKKIAGNICSYAFTADSLLMTIRNKEICTLDSLGNLSRLFKLPRAGMGISAGKYVMYAYDRNKTLSKNALYLLAKGGKYAKLLDVPRPIMSVAEMNNFLLIATGNGLFSFNIRNKELKPIAALPKDKEIKSVAVDPLGNRIYFSTESAVYTVKDTTTVIITDEFGGVLRFFSDGLIVFNPEKKLLIRILGLEDKIGSKMLALKAAATDKQSEVSSPKTETVLPVNEKPVEPAATNKVTPIQPATVPVTETVKQSEPENPGLTRQEIHLPANTIRAEKFISNTQGNLEKGKTYILKKDYSLPVDFLNNFPDGSVLKLVGSDPGQIKSWKVVKPSDGSSALIDSKLYTFFEQAHVWLLK